MVRAICFDLDDTLFPYRQYVSAGFRSAANLLETEVGVDVFDDLVTTYDEGNRSSTFDRVLAANGLSARYVPAMVKAFHDRIGPLDPYPGVPTLLDRLADDHRLGLITDGKNGHEKLAELGLEARFEFVWVSPERGVSKRSSEPFEAANRALGTAPSETAYVGDHPSVDVAVPTELGMETVRVRQGRYRDVPSAESTAVEIDSITELMTVFE